MLQRSQIDWDKGQEVEEEKGFIKTNNVNTMFITLLL